MIAIPPWVDQEAWDGFVEMRKAMKKIPFTDRAAKLILRTLIEIRDAGHDPNAALDQSTLNGWRDVYPPKDKDIRKAPKTAIEATNSYLAGLAQHEQAARSDEARQAAAAALKKLKAR